ncbi:NAD-dependent epimerase/dehydratase family protein [Sphingopyxis yananensis]|uniref:NAD-dependent epimerase/dehydratase family protein n=1 Tax=Sphingopyxis yananensis TaxID=2886687 RepID=UPI001D11CE62|nr:NAD-dependent epimerase/dehydratase family protein [Sphingopyxis yananensis]MCC2603268.1 NAD-dependent epimerase/dehydratase family protein [Sphingopyxis yananensis]
MMAEPKILLIGATGMVGEAVLEQALRAGLSLSYLARRAAVNGAGHSATIADSSDWPQHIAAIQPDIILSALGSTMKQAGSRDAFRAMDYDIQIQAARAAKTAGARQMDLVSAVGASAAARNFYLKTKGELERDVAALGFDRLDILRPGLLLGDRKGPRRWGEGVMMTAAPLFDHLMIGRLARYRSVHATDVAVAMLHVARQSDGGQFRYDSDQIGHLSD